MKTTAGSQIEERMTIKVFPHQTIVKFHAGFPKKTFWENVPPRGGFKH